MRITFHASGAETQNGTSEVFQENGMVLVGLFVTVSDVAGLLPSLTVTLQHSPDNTNWYNVGNIAVTRGAIGQAVSSPQALAMLAEYTRVSWVITGTNPSLTFTADIVTHKANT